MYLELIYSYLLLSDIRYVGVDSNKNWNDAKQNCIENGGRLMEIRTQEEYETALQSRVVLNGYKFWIGGSDIEVKGNWVWDSNQEGVILNEFWVSGSPLNTREKNCLAMSSSGMVDASCSVLRRSVCEFN